MRMGRSADSPTELTGAPQATRTARVSQFSLSRSRCPHVRNVGPHSHAKSVVSSETVPVKLPGSHSLYRDTRCAVRAMCAHSDVRAVSHRYLIGEVRFLIGICYPHRGISLSREWPARKHVASLRDVASRNPRSCSPSQSAPTQHRRHADSTRCQRLSQRLWSLQHCRGYHIGARSGRPPLP
jgi:hypothetical protein